MYQTKYHKPASAAEATSALAAATEGKILAGGQTLLPTMKLHLASPSDLVDIRKIDGMSGISFSNNGVNIGAATTHAEVAASAAVAAQIPSLADLAGGIGDPAVRHMGTMGGSLANNDPAADYPAAALALAATIVTNEREIAADDFFQGLFSTALNDNEIVTQVKFNAPNRSGYAKFKNPASRYAIVGVFIAETASGIRVAVTGAGEDGVFLHEGLQKALAANFSADAIDTVNIDASSMNSDLHADQAYRANLVKVMAKKALHKML
ncbi:carbon monoxide dehydrogenase [Chromatiales bacterium (ex Bugula neritina AB1)]|nr:carbon monoxide dehydrogenase [Chromatiales bacterium (ex Bugula neritina AB1)]